jgi:adenylate cyclase
MIRLKIISIIVLSVLLLLGTLYFFSTKILGQTLTDIENTLMVRNLARVDGTLKNTRNALNIKLRDWAQWDDTYQFIQDGNTEFSESNLKIETPVNLELNLMLFVNQDKEIVHSLYLDYLEGVELPKEYVLAEIMMHQDKLLATSTLSSASGIIQYQNSLLLIEALPIIQSDGSGLYPLREWSSRR